MIPDASLELMPSEAAGSSPGRTENILSIADIRLPLERANGIQTMETNHALAVDGARVHLLVRYLDPRHGGGSPLDFYGLSAHPRFHFTPLAFTGPLGRLRFVSACLVHIVHGATTPDVVLTRDLVIADAIAHLPARDRPRLVYEAHTIASVFADERQHLYAGGETSSPTKRRRLDRRERRVCQRADGIVAITENLRDALESRHGDLTENTVIADGCRVPTSRPPAFAGAPPHVVYVGQLYPWKGVDRLVEAVSLVSGCRLTVVGGLVGESDRLRIRELVDRLGLGSRVRLVDFVPPSGLAPYRREATLFAIPNLAGSRTSEQFTSPLKLFESMAAYRPIIASDLPSLGEVLRHEVNALLVAPGDPRAMATAIQRLADDPTLARRLADKAFEEVQQFSWESRAKRLREFFARLRRTP